MALSSRQTIVQKKLTILNPILSKFYAGLVLAACAFKVNSAGNTNSDSNDPMATNLWKTAKNVYFYANSKLTGGSLNMNDYQGKVLLVVNVASEWGLTKTNYEQLNVLHDRYKSQGLEIIAQPCNQFGKQEPLDGQDLIDHLAKYAVTESNYLDNYFTRNDVNGDSASQLFLYLQNHKNCPGILGFDSLKWNFTKFLVGRDGVPIKRFGPKEDPFSFEKHIKKALEAGGGGDVL